jgi:hypothetical protein
MGFIKKQGVIGLCLLTILCVSFTSPSANVWELLMKVKWVKKYDKKTKTNAYAPKFTKEIQALNGKQITIRGYLIPVDLYGDGDFAIISALPVANCFFCGGAGPETVMEVYTKQKIKADRSGKVTFRGRLELNPDNADHLIYILRDAKIM